MSGANAVRVDIDRRWNRVCGRHDLVAHSGVVALLDHYRFFPALDKGVPVEGTTLVELDKLDI